MHSQWKAIATKTEKITVEMIKKAASENLKLVLPMLNALREKDMEKLKKIKDLKPEWLTINNYIQNAAETVDLYGKVDVDHGRAQEKRKFSNALTELIELGNVLGLSPVKAKELGEKVLTVDEIDLIESKKTFAMLAIKQMSTNQDIPSKTNRKSGSKIKGKSSSGYKDTDVIEIVERGLSKNIDASESLKLSGLTDAFDEFV